MKKIMFVMFAILGMMSCGNGTKGESLDVDSTSVETVDTMVLDVVEDVDTCTTIVVDTVSCVSDSIDA